MESFHGRLRDECLNTSWFWNLFDARRKISSWQLAYNVTRPHSALDYRTPNEFASQWQSAELSNPMNHPAKGVPDQASATLQPDRHPFNQLTTTQKAEIRL